MGASFRPAGPDATKPPFGPDRGFVRFIRPTEAFGLARRQLPKFGWKAWLTTAAALFVAALLFSLTGLPDAAALKRKNPEKTALMEQREAEAKEAHQKARRRQSWVSLDGIASTLIEAVLVSEDQAFFEHGGVDTKQVRAALEQAWEQGHLTRGASTITQQLAKNLWLSTDRSLFRKAKELVLARRLEESLAKERILELYLNVIEWGDGVYGVEAAAREHFGVSAAELTPGESAILAAMLPAPRKWLPAKRPPQLFKRATRIVENLEKYGRLSPTAANAARLEVADRVGPAKLKPAIVARPSSPPPELDTTAPARTADTIDEPPPPPPSEPEPVPEQDEPE